MKRRIFFYSSAVLAIVMMMNMTVMPTLAKPNQVTIVLKSSIDGKPLPGRNLRLVVHTNIITARYECLTNDHGKAIFDIVNTDFTIYGCSLEIETTPGTFVQIREDLQLSKQNSTKITLYYP